MELISRDTGWSKNAITKRTLLNTRYLGMLWLRKVIAAHLRTYFWGRVSVFLIGDLRDTTLM